MVTFESVQEAAARSSSPWHMPPRPSASALPPLSFDDAREERARGGFDLRADQPAPCRHDAEWLLSGVLCHITGEHR